MLNHHCYYKTGLGNLGDLFERGFADERGGGEELKSLGPQFSVVSKQPIIELTGLLF